jgi:hypothetical protein
MIALSYELSSQFNLLTAVVDVNYRHHYSLAYKLEAICERLARLFQQSNPVAAIHHKRREGYYRVCTTIIFNVTSDICKSERDIVDMHACLP